MEDEKILDLYWQRDEEAIRATEQKYGRYLYAIAYRILGSRADTEECVNDVYLDAWERMPPHRPSVLSSFLGMLSRRRALDKWRRMHAARRGGREVALSLSELEECLPGEDGVTDGIEVQELAVRISAFLRTLPEVEANIFLRRYWYMDSIAAIARRYRFGISCTKMILFRTRKNLAEYLKKEGVI